MTLRTTRTETRARGPLALAGGVVVVGVALAAVALAPPPAEVGAVLPTAADATDAVDGIVRPAAAPAERVAVVDRTRRAPAPADQAVAELPIPDALAVPASTAAWAAHYRALPLAALQAELPEVFGPEGVKIRRVGYLEALAEHGGEASAPGFLAAAAFPGDPDDARGVSLASYAVGTLAERAADPDFRAVLADLAWRPDRGLAPRLRARAAARLVQSAAATEALTLHAHLYAERDALVLASAASAARLAQPEVRAALAPLFPDADLAAWTLPAGLDLGDPERATRP